jgi:hypothetical protein
VSYRSASQVGRVAQHDDAGLALDSHLPSFWMEINALATSR